MPFTVMSWNLQRKTTRSARNLEVRSVIRAYKPDVLFLSEISHNYTVFGYEEVAHALSINISHKMGANQRLNELSTKLFVKKESELNHVTARALRQGADQPRARIKASFKVGVQKYDFSFVHSKASQRSAGLALQETKGTMRNYARSIIVGDQNFAIDKSAAREQAESDGYVVHEMVDAVGNPLTATHKAGKKLDYLVAKGDDFTVAPVHQKVDTMMFPVLRGRWRPRTASNRVVPLSDHRPIVFEIR